jgi:hypothetical protein
MAHFAQLNNDNMVIQVIVIGNDIAVTEAAGQDFIANTLKLDGVWIQTSYNNNIRKQYAAIGGTYNADADVFVAPQPFPSWSLDLNHDWQAPTPRPEGSFYWDEESLSWLAIPVG